MYALLIHRPEASRWCIAVAFVAGIVTLVGTLRSRHRDGNRSAPTVRSALLVLLTVVILLAARVEMSDTARMHVEFVAAAKQERAIEFQADVVGFPRATAAPAGGASFGMQAMADMHGAAVPVNLWLDGAPDVTFGPGTRVAVRGRPKPAMLGATSAWHITVRSLQVVAPAGGWNATASRLRASLLAAASPVASASLVPGFAVGDTSLVNEDLSADMLETGLTHLTAVSGANCALVVSAGIWLASRLGLGRRARLPIAGLFLLGFVGIVGPDSSVQRAAVMAAVVLISQFAGKRSQALSALGAAVLILLIRDPWEAVQAGFALSVTATLGILLFSRQFTSGLKRRCRVPGWLATPFALTLAAQLTCGPLLLLLQSGVSIVSVFANVLAAPAAPLGTALGLGATIVLPVAEQAGTCLVYLAAIPARWIEIIAAIGSELPFGRWHWSGGWFGAGALALVEAIGVMLVAVITRQLSRGTWETGKRRLPWGEVQRLPVAAKRISVLLGATSAGIALTMIGVAPVASKIGIPQDWAIVSCDVGQGDATLLRDPERPDFVMLVDTGDDEHLLQQCLKRFGVSRIDQLVLTHDDRDHVGALDAVAGITETVIIAPANADDGEDRALVKSLRAHGLTPVIVRQGDTGGAVPGGNSGLWWKALAPAQGVVPKDTNAASIVMSVSIQGQRILMLADTGKDEQKSMLAAGLDVSSDIVKIAHHGSKDQYLTLYEQVGAGAAFVSVGSKNRYGHPNQELLSALQKMGMQTWRTDDLGTVVFVLEVQGLRGFHMKGRGASVRLP
ncbi:ComEC/Rec2 family competence protein [Leucobacter sp. cx-42]|uniref:ComEC/Rec2 family competence protein n=1 Tax=unclassified Leucobacter TaxID=2621730 RepID=UPI00165DCBBD|nr:MULTISPECIES: ComEC/Rec2 family competence protein [unclassified Leucobacter]MBC9954661.1 ComEC/Rec2 family competence protein [Leucobacter sp. cx-42]